MSHYSVGKARPSQLLWTYGPGALIDLPNLSVLTMGLDYWNPDLCPPIEETRLLAAVRGVLGNQVNRLRMPPFLNANADDPGNVGAPVKPFPRWLRCVRCGLLAEYDSGLFTIVRNRYRPDQTRFVHTNCPNGENADAVPARFLVACRNGHLDDFPWRWFVHRGPSVCTGTLRFFESGASLQTENLWVKCDECGAARSMADAFGQKAKESLPSCRGRHPHLNTYEKCTEDLRTIILGASNGWFPMTLSVLAIPLDDEFLEQMITDGWTCFVDAKSEQEIDIILKTLIKIGSLPGIEKLSSSIVWKAVKARKETQTVSKVNFDGDIKGPEWAVLTSDNPPMDWPHFLSRKTEVPEGYRNRLASVLLLERLREVNALIGYTRVEPPEESDVPEERPPMAALSKEKPTWIPASEVHGEGIFIRFDENAVAKWECQESVQERSKKLEDGHRGWRRARRLDPEKGYPGIRYVMLHTFAHLLIREFALHCGYNTASIRERIYARSDCESPMAGVLIYTAAADSDGTLGGLVDLGKTENLRSLIDQASHRAAVCSSDPLCSEHDPSEDRSLHLAACHSCSFVPETSCERGNRYLDRALLVKTMTLSDTAFFFGSA